MKLGNLLQLTLEEIIPTEKKEITLAGTTLEWICEGVVRVTPKESGNSQKLDFLMSAGIHGNETAPIELLDRLLQSIADDVLIPTARVLFVLGNPYAIRAGVRFIEDDINRMFNGKHSNYPSTSKEAKRASQLEQLTEDFFSSSKYPVDKLHYDCHTAIRGSFYEKFALYPYSEGREKSQREIARLSEAGMESLLIQNDIGITFSSYTYGKLGAESFTLELGKARPLGQNQEINLNQLESILKSLISQPDYEVKIDAIDKLKMFKVSREIIKQSNMFKLNLDEKVENFTELKEGFIIAEDENNKHWVVEESHARIVFPNPSVKIGLRAGIIVVPSL